MKPNMIILNQVGFGSSSRLTLEGFGALTFLAFTGASFFSDIPQFYWHQ